MDIRALQKTFVIKSLCISAGRVQPGEEQDRGLKKIDHNTCQHFIHNKFDSLSQQGKSSLNDTSSTYHSLKQQIASHLTSHAKTILDTLRNFHIYIK